ncbi:hypothetical protein ACJX0J_018052, partial [Zea mays]
SNQQMPMLKPLFFCIGLSIGENLVLFILSLVVSIIIRLAIYNYIKIVIFTSLEVTYDVLDPFSMSTVKYILNHISDNV